MNSDKKALYAAELLKKKYLELGRLPVKKDFSSGEVCLIKQKLGPWPRALEAAGLKEPPIITSKEKSRLKRERSRRLRKERKKAEKETFENSD